MLDKTIVQFEIEQRVDSSKTSLEKIYLAWWFVQASTSHVISQYSDEYVGRDCVQHANSTEEILRLARYAASYQTAPRPWRTILTQHRFFFRVEHIEATPRRIMAAEDWRMEARISTTRMTRSRLLVLYTAAIHFFLDLESLWSSQLKSYRRDYFLRSSRN